MTSQLSVSTYYGLIKLLSTCVKGSHTVAENLLQAGMSRTLCNLLQRSAAVHSALPSASTQQQLYLAAMGFSPSHQQSNVMMCASCSSTLFSTSRTSPASVLRSSDQLVEVVSLAHELLPPVPDAAQLLLADANPATEAEGKALSECHHHSSHMCSSNWDVWHLPL